MSQKNLIIFLLFAVFLLANNTHGQTKRLKIKKSQAVVKKQLGESQKGYLQSIIDAAESAELSYSIEVSTSDTGKNLLKLNHTDFTTKLSELKNLSLPECLNLPSRLEEQSEAVQRTHDRLSQFYLLADGGLRDMSYIQYENRRRAILEGLGVGTAISNSNALRIFESLAIASKNKLQYMMNVYPKSIAPDRDVNQGADIILVPIPSSKFPSDSSVKPCSEK